MRFLVLWDLYRAAFLVTVRLIALAVFTFRKSYIAGETHYARFHLILLVFVVSIFVLVVRPGLVSLLLG